MGTLGERAEFVVFGSGDVVRAERFVQVRFGLAERAECDLQVAAKLAG